MFRTLESQTMTSEQQGRGPLFNQGRERARHHSGAVPSADGAVRRQARERGIFCHGPRDHSALPRDRDAHCMRRDHGGENKDGGGDTPISDGAINHDTLPFLTRNAVFVEADVRRKKITREKFTEEPGTCRKAHMVSLPQTYVHARTAVRGSRHSPWLVV